VYSGSATNASSTSAPAKLVITAAPTTVAASGTSSVTVGGTVTLVATVSRPAGYTGVPSGQVNFYQGAVLLGSAALDGTGKATFRKSTSGIALGSYGVVAKYAGDTSDSASASSALTVEVTKAETEVTMTAQINPVTKGSPISIATTVTHACCSTAPPSGTVTFLMGTQTLNTLKLSSGSVTLSVSTANIAPGTYDVVAKYSGDATNQPSTSTLSVTVAAPAASSSSAAVR
jgi:hypothetical protein